MDGGVEIRLFDRRRNPRDWTDLIRPTQCAVFLKDRHTSASLAPDGQRCTNAADIRCIVFDRLDAAQRFCEARVEVLPDLRCEIYDSQGLAHPPLLVIMHPDIQLREEPGPLWSRRRKVIAGGLALISVPLFWLAVRRSNSDFFAFLAFSCILLALRFLYWDFGLKHREKERRRRLEQHRRMERGDA